MSMENQSSALPPEWVSTLRYEQARDPMQLSYNKNHLDKADRKKYLDIYDREHEPAKIPNPKYGKKEGEKKMMDNPNYFKGVDMLKSPSPIDMQGFEAMEQKTIVKGKNRTVFDPQFCIAKDIVGYDPTKLAEPKENRGKNKYWSVQKAKESEADFKAEVEENERYASVIAHEATFGEICQKGYQEQMIHASYLMRHAEKTRYVLVAKNNIGYTDMSLKETRPGTLAAWVEANRENRLRERSRAKVRDIRKSVKRHLRKLRKAEEKLSKDGSLSSDEDEADVKDEIAELKQKLYGKSKTKDGEYKNCLRKEYDDAVAEHEKNHSDYEPSDGEDFSWANETDDEVSKPPGALQRSPSDAAGYAQFKAQFKNIDKDALARFLAAEQAAAEQAAYEKEVLDDMEKVKQREHYPKTPLTARTRFKRVEAGRGKSPNKRPSKSPRTVKSDDDLDEEEGEPQIKA